MLGIVSISMDEIGQRKSKRQAAKDARCKILQLIQEEEDWRIELDIMSDIW
jgi:hypothetical protein